MRLTSHHHYHWLRHLLGFSENEQFFLWSAGVSVIATAVAVYLYGAMHW